MQASCRRLPPSSETTSIRDHLCGPTRLLLSATAALGLLASSATALAPLQTPLELAPVADGITRPIWAGAPDGDSRIFVLEATTGLIKIIDGGTVLPQPFLDVSAELLVQSHSGLLSMAFHPDFESNRYVYVYYTTESPQGVTPNPTRVRLERYTVSAANPNVCDPASALIIFEDHHPNPIHKGQGPLFGPDGMLYLIIGQAGAELEFPACAEQRLDNYYGKVLRIDVDGGTPYAVPPDNPFVGVPGALPEIYHLGLRNPWRCSFDPETGGLYLADVGDQAIEEVNYAPLGAAGLNFGWPVMEGIACYAGGCPPAAEPCNSPALTEPIYGYQHDNPPGSRSVTGGFVYRGCAIPDYRGTYFFADFATGEFFAFTYDELTGLSPVVDLTSQFDPLNQINDVASFGEDGDGELLVCSYFSGRVYRMVPGVEPTGFVDCDSNGLDDACEIATGKVADLDGNGVPDGCDPLSTGTVELSLSSGGAQNLTLATGSAQGSQLFFVLGSASGTTPGFAFDGSVVPLNLPDSYFDFTLTNPNEPPLVNTIGSLDIDGGAQAMVVLPAGAAPALAGVALHHCGLVFEIPGSGALTFVTNAVPLTLVP